MTFVGVALLTEGSRAHPIEVRLVRKWRPRPKSLETFYIFVDTQNDAIQGFYAAKDQLNVDTKLQTRHCYQISGYACTGIDKNSKVIPNSVSIRIGRATSIEHVTNIPEIPINYFCFGDYNDIREMATGLEKVIDYIGVLEAIEHGRTRKSSKPYVNLKITDSSNEVVFITLWEEIANVFKRFPRVTIQQAAKPTIIAVTSLRYNQYSGRFDLQSTAATHVYLNPDHPAKKILLESYNPDVAHDNTQLALFASNAEKITVADLLQKEHPMPTEKTYMCEAFIAEILTTDGWYYVGCLKCNGTAHKSGDIWFCTDCGDIKDIKYKSRIVVLISDGQSNLKVAMFDDTLTLLLTKPLHDIITHDGYDDNTTIPEPISKICGEKRFFVLKPQREQYINTPKFIVKQILPLDFLNKPLLLEAAPLDTPPPPTPPSTQLDSSPSDADSTTKRKLLFEIKGTSTPISDTKHIKYN